MFELFKGSALQVAGRTVAAVILAGLAAEARATILIFDQGRDAVSSTIVVPAVPGGAVPQDYGDRVFGSPQPVLGGEFTYGEAGEGFTPNVVVEYVAGDDPETPRVSLWETQYGDLNNVIFAAANTQKLNIRLSADPAYEVELFAFDVAGWANADYTINAVRVLDDAGAVVWSESDVLIEGDFDGPRRTSFDFATPLVGPELLIEIDFSNLAAGQQDNIGVDNIRFGQNPPGIPEPAAWLLLVTGAATLAATRRRRREVDWRLFDRRSR